jgi:hypothetical protein
VGEAPRHRLIQVEAAAAAHGCHRSSAAGHGPGRAHAAPRFLNLGYARVRDRQRAIGGGRGRRRRRRRRRRRVHRRRCRRRAGGRSSCCRGRLAVPPARGPGEVAAACRAVEQPVVLRVRAAEGAEGGGRGRRGGDGHHRRRRRQGGSGGGWRSHGLAERVPDLDAVAGAVGGDHSLEQLLEPVGCCRPARRRGGQERGELVEGVDALLAQFLRQTAALLRRRGWQMAGTAHHSSRQYSSLAHRLVVRAVAGAAVHGEPLPHRRRL